MTFVNLKNRPLDKNFNNVMDTFFNGFPSVYKDDFQTPVSKNFTPVNVIETEDGYELELLAPGLEKENFKVDLDKNILTLSAEVKKEEEAKTGKYLRWEHTVQSFKRSFTLSENVDAEKIDAKYVNGVLKVALPKKAEIKAAVKQITIQ